MLQVLNTIAFLKAETMTKICLFTTAQREVICCTQRNAINHARKKGANIAVLFDYNKAFKLSDITHGTKHYEDAYRDAKHSSVKTLIVVSGRGNVHEWELFK